MPHFIPVQCHKCSALQIKPAQKFGPKWCCSACRKPETKVNAAPESDVSDVSLFVEELNLPQEAEEMDSVANTFRGVENLDGVFNWDGLYFKSAKRQHQNKWKHFKPIEIYEDECPDRAPAGDVSKLSGEKRVNLRASGLGLKRVEPQHRLLLNYLWTRWHQKACNKEAVELMEFAGDVGNEENVPPAC